MCSKKKVNHKNLQVSITLSRFLFCGELHLIVYNFNGGWVLVRTLSSQLAEDTRINPFSLPNIHCFYHEGTKASPTFQVFRLTNWIALISVVWRNFFSHSEPFDSLRIFFEIRFYYVLASSLPVRQAYVLKISQLNGN